MYDLNPPPTGSLSLPERASLQRRYLSRLFLDTSKGVTCPVYLEQPRDSTIELQLALFVNSIGGLGDTIPILMAMELFKKYVPQSQTLLYDSMFQGHYFDLVGYADYWVQASEHLYEAYAPGMIRQMDPSLPVAAGIPFVTLKDVGISHFVSTHSAHQRRFPSSTGVVEMDLCTFIVDSILHGCMPFQPQLRSAFSAKFEEFFASLNPDNRLLVGIQNRGKNPYGTHQIAGAEYIASLEKLANLLVEKFDARVIHCGDLPLNSPKHHASGSWINLDTVQSNIYFKLEAMRRCDYFFGASSGFSMIANLMRRPDQSPGMLLFGSLELLEGITLAEMYPTYVQDGGGIDITRVVWSYQHPSLTDFLFDLPHTPEKAIAFMEQLMEERKRDIGETGAPRNRWRVPSKST
jgi:hypothetical protein